MVVLAAFVKIRPEYKSRFLRAGYAMLPLSRREHGCIDYNFYVDPHDDFGFIFYEKWDSREALQAHFETEHFKTFAEIVGEMVREPNRIEIHTVTATEHIPPIATHDPLPDTPPTDLPA